MVVYEDGGGGGIDSQKQMVAAALLMSDLCVSEGQVCRIVRNPSHVSALK